MKNIFKLAILALAILPMCLMTSCDQNNGFELTDGVPVIKYIRPQDVAAKDSLLTEAYLGSSLTIVGENLTSIKEMYFNDQAAVLNTSYITYNTMLVTVPKNIPGEVKDMIIMITKDGQEVTYPFHVAVPGPVVNSMACEHVKAGEEAIIYGQYFVDDPNVPLTITFTGEQRSHNVVVPNENIKEITQSSIRFVVPDDAVMGQIQVATVYGSALSKFYFRDKRNVITDFDGAAHAGSETGIIPQGWNLKPTYLEENGVDGFYCQVGPATTEGGWVEDLKLSFWAGNWNGDPMSIQKGEAGVPIRNCYDMSDWQNMSFKMELCIPSSNPWSAGALQIIFVNNQQCANDSWQNNTYIHTSANGGLDLPRALYRPWATTGSYDTGDQWITVTIPLTDFIYNDDGTKSPKMMSEQSFDSFIMWPKDGGVPGKECTPIFRYDNLRIVPNL